MINYENDNFELLSPREMMRIEFKEFFFYIEFLGLERHLSRWIKDSQFSPNFTESIFTQGLCKDVG